MLGVWEDYCPFYGCSPAQPGCLCVSREEPQYTATGTAFRFRLTFFSSLRSLPNRDALPCYESEPIAFTFLILALSPHQWHRLALITPSVASLGPFHPINGSADCGHLKRVWCDVLSELRSCVKVEVAVLGSRPLYAYGFCGRKATLQRSLSALPVIVGRSSLALRR